MSRNSIKKWLVAGLAISVISVMNVLPTKAEVSEIKMAQQFGLLYVPLHVVLDHKLVEKHAKALGLPEPQIKLFKISGGANINKALLSKSIDFGAHGIGAAQKLWSKTNGKFKIASGMADMPMKLMTTDKNIKTMDDFLKAKNHKIATPAAKVSTQALILQMYAKKKWGDATKLDHLVVSMKHPTALATILSGGQAIQSHFATLPYSYQEMQSGKVRQIIDSYEVMGGQSTLLVMSTSQEFKDANPKTYKAVLNAYDEAFKWINANPQKAAELYIRYSKTKLDPNLVKAMLTNKKEIAFDPRPKNTLVFAEHLASLGDIKMPKSWKDYYFENMHDQDGS